MNDPDWLAEWGLSLFPEDEDERTDEQLPEPDEEPEDWQPLDERWPRRPQ